MLNGETTLSLWQFLRLIAFGIAGVLTVLVLIGVVTPRASRMISPRHREDSE